MSWPNPTKRFLGLFLGLALFGNLASAQELKASSDYPSNAKTDDGQTLDFPRNNPAVQIISDDSKEIGNDSAVAEGPGVPFWDSLFSHGSPFYFGLTVGETYDDNIFISHIKHGDFYTHVTPMLDFVKGDKEAIDANYLNVVFRPTLFFYDRFDDENRVDYYADGLFQHQFTRLKLSVEQRFEELTDASIDVGNFFKRDVYTTVLNGSYDYNDKLSFGGSETQRLSFFTNQQISQTNEWITDLYARYQPASKLSVGIGPRFGFVDISGAPNQAYQDLLVRVGYDIDQKLNVNAEAGAEYRQFQNSSDRLFPIFDFSANYTPFDSTLITLSGYRDDVISYSEVGDDYLSTVVQLGLRQRFLQKFFFLLSAGYNWADYQSVAGGSANVQRRDRYYFANTGLEWDPREWISVSARAQFSEDDSNFVQNSFTDSQVDVQSALQF